MHKKLALIGATFLLVLAALIAVVYHVRYSSWYFYLTLRLGLNKGGEERATLVRVRAVGTAFEMYREKYGMYPEVPVPDHPFSPKFRKSYNLGYEQPRPELPWPVDTRREVSRLRSTLEPVFGQVLPVVDWWGYPLYYDVTEDRMHYCIISLGSDGQPESRFIPEWEESETNHDIVRYDAYFLCVPEGIARY